MSVKELFTTFSDFFFREKLDFALIGAFSLHAYGYTRTTRDIDFLTRLEYQETIVKFCDDLGFETLQKSTAFSNHLHPLGNNRIDFMYVEGKTAATIFSRVRYKTFFTPVKVPVVCPEHLVALKLFAARNDPDRRYREFADIKELCRYTHVNLNAVRTRFLTYGFEDFYDELSG